MFKFASPKQFSVECNLHTRDYIIPQMTNLSIKKQQKVKIYQQLIATYHTAHHVRRPPFLGHCGQKQKHSAFCHQRRNGTRLRKYNADLFGLTQYGNHRQSQQAHFKPTLNLQRQVHLFPRDGFGLQKYDKQW